MSIELPDGWDPYAAVPPVGLYMPTMFWKAGRIFAPQDRNKVTGKAELVLVHDRVDMLLELSNSRNQPRDSGEPQKTTDYSATFPVGTLIDDDFVVEVLGAAPATLRLKVFQTMPYLGTGLGGTRAVLKRNW